MKTGKIHPFKMRQGLPWLPNTFVTSCIFVLFISFSAHAQFTSGSTGSDGALDVTASIEIPLPADGIFNYTTITVAAGATLTFTRNDLNTTVHMLATGI